MPLTLEQIKKLQAKFDNTLDPSFSFHGDFKKEDIPVLEHLIVCLVGEMGEFSNLVKKIRRGDFSFTDKQSELNEELIDIFIYLIKISNHLQVDLEKLYLQKLEKNKKRFLENSK